MLLYTSSPCSIRYGPHPSSPQVAEAGPPEVPREGSGAASLTRFCSVIEPSKLCCGWRFRQLGANDRFHGFGAIIRHDACCKCCFEYFYQRHHSSHSSLTQSRRRVPVNEDAYPVAYQLAAQGLSRNLEKQL